MIEVTLLGTGSPMVDAKRAGPSTMVRAGDQIFLVDCGRGVLQRAAAVGVGAANLTALLLTHLHSDHITDLNDVITTRWVTTFVRTPLPIIGPPGTAALVAATLDALAPDISYRIAHHADITEPPAVEVHEYTEGSVWDDRASEATGNRASGRAKRRGITTVVSRSGLGPPITDPWSPPSDFESSTTGHRSCWRVTRCPVRAWTNSPPGPGRWFTP
jgi:ribonuclease Z